MLPLYVIAVGNLKEPYLKSAEGEYKKRLSGLLQLTELAETKLPDSPSPASIEKALAEEGKRILSAVPKGAYLIGLCVEGTGTSSEAFAESLAKLSVEGRPSCALVIGSSYGLSDEVKARCDRKLSLSPMTLPHQLCRIVVLEQLYRVVTIERGQKYHK